MGKTLDIMQQIADDRTLGINALPYNRHATVNDTVVAQAMAGAVAHRSNETIAKSGFQTVRHAIDAIPEDDPSGWNKVIKAILVAGGIGLAGYLIYMLIQTIREQNAVVAVAQKPETHT